MVFPPFTILSPTPSTSFLSTKHEMTDSDSGLVNAYPLTANLYQTALGLVNRKLA
jgi:hypothetical protein